MSTVNLHDDILICAAGAGFVSVEALTGVFRALEEHNLVPGKANASSGSAIFNSLYYSGHDSDWFVDLMNKTNLKDWVKLDTSSTLMSIVGYGNYVIDTTAIRNLLFDNMTVEASRRVKVSVTDEKTGRGLMLPATPDTVAMAQAFPIAIIPVGAYGMVGKDGGIVNNLPLCKVKEVANYRYVFAFIPKRWKPTTSKNHLIQAADMINQLRTQELNQIEEAGYFDEPNFIPIELENEFDAGIFSWSTGFELRDYAYQLMRDIIEQKNLA